MRAALLTNQLFLWENPNELAIGGGERFSLQFAQLLLDLGYEVHIYQYSPVGFDKMHNGTHVHGIPNFKGDGLLWTGMCDYFYDYTKRFDRVFINLPDFAAGKVRGDATLITHGVLWCNKPVGELPDDKKEKLCKIWSKVYKNVVVHEFTRETIRELGLDDVADKIVCIGNYVDTDIFKPANKKPIIIFPGRAEVFKGTGLMQEVLERLSDTGWEVAWVGDGAQFDKLKTLEDKYSNFSAISVPLDTMHEVYSHASICMVFNISSRGNSLTLMESMASGCACIGIDGGTTLIEDKVNGLLCKPNAQDVADKIKQLIADEDLRNRLGFQSRKDIISEHNKEKWEREWINVIDGEGGNMTDIYQERYVKHQEAKKNMTATDKKPEYTDTEIMTLFKVMHERRSQRLFNDDNIDTDRLKGIMKAAELAPSSCNRKAVRAELIRSEHDISLLSKLLVGGSGWLENANAVVLLLADMAAYKSPAEVGFMPFLDAGVIAQNIYLIGEALGVGACFVNPNIREADKEEFDSSFLPDGYRFCGALALGNYDLREAKHA